MDDGNQREIIISELSKRLPKKPIRRVLLIQPPDGPSAESFDLAAAQKRRYSAFQPNGLLIIAEHLRNNGFEVKILDLNFLLLTTIFNSQSFTAFDYVEIWKNFLHKELDDFDPDLVGVTCMFTMTHSVFKGVVREIKQYKNVPIVIGGVHVTNDTERILRDVEVADAACLHESEISFVRLLQFINGEKSAEKEKITQIAMLIDEQFYKIKEVRSPTSEELSVLPSYDLINAGNYSMVGSIGSFMSLLPLQTRIGTVLTNRGCRAQCAFCSVRSFNGSGVRSRSMESVVDEIALLYNDFGIRHIMWLDDDLFYNEKRTIGIFNEIVRRNLKITWDASNGVIAAAATEEIVQAAAESGCIGLFFGIESGNPLMLRQVRKPGTVDKFREAAARLKRYPQIFSRGFLMIGFPNETLQMMTDTLNLALEMSMDWYNITILQPLPSTPIYQFLAEQGLLEDQIQETGEVKYNVGPFGKQREVEKCQRAVAANFAEEFSRLKLDEIPPKNQLLNIWFYMNYKINFERLKNLENPLKISMRLRYLGDITNRIAPGHVAAYFYTALLEEKSGNLERAKLSAFATEKALADSAYWRDKFTAFKLYDELEALKARLSQGQ